MWEQMDRLVRTGRFDDAPGLLRVIVRRAYAGEAAAAQTGMGSPTTRGLIGAIRRAEAGQIAELGVRGCNPAVDEHADIRCAASGCGRWPRFSRSRGGGGRCRRCTR